MEFADLKDATGIGRTLVRLGLQENFLERKKLLDFPVSQRSKIVGEIVDESLAQGNWEEVIKIIYGKSWNADMFYEEDLNSLDERIVACASANPRHEHSITLEILCQSGKGDLLFKLSTLLTSVNYESYKDLMGHIAAGGLNDEAKQREVQEVAGKKAMAAEDYEAALYHFKNAEDADGVTSACTNILSSQQRISLELAERIASADLSKKRVRLKELVLSALEEREPGSLDKGLSLLDAYELWKSWGIQLNKKDSSKLQSRVAETARNYELDKIDNRIALLWAKKHAASDPGKAYEIFKNQGYNGREVNIAVIKGLEEDKSTYITKIDISGIRTEDLEKAYKTKGLSFGKRVTIARRLNSPNELLSLSSEALRRKDKQLAYELFVLGKGDLTSEEICDVKEDLITKAIHEGREPYFINSSDISGMFQVYYKLMENAKGKHGADNVLHAYNIARKLGEEVKLQKAREKMVEIRGARWALRVFSREYGGEEDKKGIDYILSTASGKEKLDKGLLEKLINGCLS